jgi:hypothetical protein
MQRSREREPVLPSSSYLTAPNLQGNDCMSNRDLDSRKSFDGVADLGQSSQITKRRKDVREAVIAEDDLEKERDKSKPSSLSSSYLGVLIDIFIITR